MSDEGDGFTDSQVEVLTLLPGKRRDIAEELGISLRAVRGRMDGIESNGGRFSRDEDGLWHWSGEESLDSILEGYGIEYRGGLEAATDDEDSSDDEFSADDLTERETYLIQSVLPASTEEVANELKISPRVADTHIEDLKDRGIPIEYDETNEAWYVPEGKAKRKIGSRHMGTITRKANDWLGQVEDVQIRQARSIDPVIAVQEPEEGNEDVVAALSDLHVGQSVEDEYGDVIYGEAEWKAAVREFTQKCLSIPERMVAPHIEFDTIHLLLNGDMVTNENIYNHQIEDIGAYLADQIDIAVEELVQLVFTLAEHYPKVNVVCQVGNHGEMRASGNTKQANADLFVYRELERVLYYSEYENVNFQVGDATAYKTFRLRGGEWHAFATHGQATYEQITGTSASDSQMQNWLVGLNEQPDIFYLGHYHEYRHAPVNGVPAVRIPSPKPGGVYEWKLGKMEARNAIPQIGYIHGVSDDRIQTWQTVIDAVDNDKLYSD
jgi:DNA-binding Lrp family transcriptional regulator